MSGMEARVLTAYEVRRLPRGAQMWVQYVSDEKQEVDDLSLAMKCKDGTVVDEEGSLFYDFENDLKPDMMGFRWIFWSSKPTTKQVREVVS